MLNRSRIAVSLVLAPGLFGLMSASARPAAADAKTCIRAHSTGQRESKAGHLRLASQLFTTCGSDETCPDQLRKECAEFLESVKRTIPTVIFSVLDETGADVSSARVFSGDDPLADSLDGRAIEIDPGKYHLRFVLSGGETLITDVVIREGEKDRLVQVKKERLAPVAYAPASGSEKAESPKHVLGPAPWIAAGTAVAALGAGVALGLVGNGKKSQLDQCKPDCPGDLQSTYSSAKGFFLGADISFGVAVVATGVATWLFVSGSGHDDHTPTSPAARSPAVQPVVSFVPGGGMAAVSGAF
jgi:hypothetical protein